MSTAHRVHGGVKGKHEASTKSRIEQFFLDNPTEELTRVDMVTKFDASPKAVEMALMRLRSEGAVIREVVYRAASLDDDVARTQGAA